MKILHNKVELDKGGCTNLDQDTICNIHKMVKDLVGDDYTVITSPLDINLINSEDVILRIDCKEYTYNELVEILSKYEQN